VRISVIGAGRVGLVVGVCFAKLGNEVAIVDVDAEKVKAINRKACPFYEEGLPELLNQVNIEASCEPRKIEEAEVILLCVGTFSNKDGSLSLDQVTEATERISDVLKRKEDYCVVAVKSTVPPGTTEDLISSLLQESGKRIGEHFGVCATPEFLREGKAIHDFMNPSRIIIGEYDKRSGDTLMNLYKNFNAPILRTNLRTAEMIKLACNAFLATKISFINEIGNICKKLDIDVYEVAKGMGFDERIGSKFLNAGIGFGGSCLPKDIKGLVSKSRQVGYEPGLLQEVLNLNEKQPLKLVDLLKKHVSLKGATVGLLGVAFKPETDDVRDSRAAEIARALLSQGAIVKAYDPLATENFRLLFPQIQYVSKQEVLDCDAILIVTEWEEFDKLDYKGKIVIDGRRVAKAKEAKIYEGVCW